MSNKLFPNDSARDAAMEWLAEYTAKAHSIGNVITSEPTATHIADALALILAALRAGGETLDQRAFKDAATIGGALFAYGYERGRESAREENQK